MPVDTDYYYSVLLQDRISCVFLGEKGIIIIFSDNIFLNKLSHHMSVYM